MQTKISVTPKKRQSFVTLYGYYTILQLLIAKGKEMLHADYSIDRAPILRLITYFFQDESLADHPGIDLYKGLIITGPVGCEKTAIMRIIRSLLHPNKRFPIRLSPVVSLAFMREGYAMISRYSKQCFDQYSIAPRPCCIDDLGLLLHTDI